MRLLRPRLLLLMLFHLNALVTGIFVGYVGWPRGIRVEVTAIWFHDKEVIVYSCASVIQSTHNRLLLCLLTRRACRSVVRSPIANIVEILRVFHHECYSVRQK